jgi:type II secretory pathway component GspD/PulD (secretin)
MPPTSKGVSLQHRLQLPVSVNFKETPLQQVLTDLAANCGVNIVIDPRAIREVNLDVNTPVSLRIEGVSLKSVLKVLAQDVRLLLKMNNDSVELTTRWHAYGRAKVATYQISDLLDNEFKVDRVIQLVVDTIEPMCWAENGGPGKISYDSGRHILVVTQYVELQEQTQDLLSALRRLREDKATKRGDLEVDPAIQPN